MCLFCYNQRETIHHIFLQYDFASCLWFGLHYPLDQIVSLLIQSHIGLTNDLIFGKMIKKKRAAYKFLLTMMILENIWLSRNQTLMEELTGVGSNETS